MKITQRLIFIFFINIIFFSYHFCKKLPKLSNFFHLANFSSFKLGIIFFRYYTTKRAVKRTMTLNQFSEMRDTRIVLGIIGLFYITNALTFYNSFAHIMHLHVPPIIPLLASLSLVLNSTFKFLIYVIFSSRFRKGVKKLLVKNATLDRE